MTSERPGISFPPPPFTQDKPLESSLCSLNKHASMSPILFIPTAFSEGEAWLKDHRLPWAEKKLVRFLSQVHMTKEIKAMLEVTHHETGG